MSADIYRYKVF